MADAEQFGTTVIGASWRPRVIGVGVGYELPSWDAAKVCASTKDHDDVIGWIDAFIHGDHVFEMTDVLSRFIVSFHHLESSLVVVGWRTLPL